MPASPHHADPTTQGPDTLPVLRGVPRRAWLPRMVDDAPGCGWFESSQALRQGLAVTEWALDEAWSAFTGAAAPAASAAPACGGSGGH
jgi:hypothetical protein